VASAQNELRQMLSTAHESAQNRKRTIPTVRFATIGYGQPAIGPQQFDIPPPAMPS
jgi:hypothetical protein